MTTEYKNVYQFNIAVKVNVVSVTKGFVAEILLFLSFGWYMNISVHEAPITTDLA